MYLTGACRTDKSAKTIEVVLDAKSGLESFGPMLWNAATLAIRLQREIWFYVSSLTPVMDIVEARTPRKLIPPDGKFHWQTLSVFKVMPDPDPTYRVEVPTADAGDDEDVLTPEGRIRGISEIEALFLD